LERGIPTAMRQLPAMCLERPDSRHLPCCREHEGLPEAWDSQRSAEWALFDRSWWPLVICTRYFIGRVRAREEILSDAFHND